MFNDFDVNKKLRSLEVVWNHPYIYCKKITVLLNNVRVCTNLGPETRICRYNNLESNAKYIVKITAQEDGLNNISASNELTAGRS